MLCPIQWVDSGEFHSVIARERLPKSHDQHESCRFLSDLPLTALSTSNSLPCENFPGLSKTLLHLCIQQPEVVLSIGEGIRLGLDECQSQFKDQRWNCSLIHSQNQAAAQRAGKLALKGKIYNGFLNFPAILK